MKIIIPKVALNFWTQAARGMLMMAYNQRYAGASGVIENSVANKWRTILFLKNGRFSAACFGELQFRA
ncbi:MAG: hypothetical protein ACLP9S_15050 [Syntrophales bacterium]|jgi:hypothetical protein